MNFTGDAAPHDRPFERHAVTRVRILVSPLAQHSRNMPDRLRRLGATQHEIVFAVAQQAIRKFGEPGEQFGARAPQPADIVRRQQQIRRPSRFEKGPDRPGRRVEPALVAVEKIDVAVHGGRDRHFQERVAAELVAGRKHGEKISRSQTGALAGGRGQHPRA
jgi:hypothetical protein